MRRRSIAYKALIFLFFISSVPAARGAEETPRLIVEGFQETMLAVMKEAKTLGFRGRYERLAPAIARAFDLPLMVRIAIGSYWNLTSAEQRTRLATAFDFFLEAYGPKYEKATACLAKDRDALLSFYDFPAEHWKHVRTTNPIESTFATVRLRTYRTKGCLSRKTAMAMVFKLCQGASKKWRRLNGSDQFAEIIRGVKFVNGERQDRAAA